MLQSPCFHGSQRSALLPLICKVVIPDKPKDERKSCHARSDDLIQTACDPTLRDASHAVEVLIPGGRTGFGGGL